MLWLPQAIKQLWLPGFFLALFITVQSGAFSGELSTAANTCPRWIADTCMPLYRDQRQLFSEKVPG